MVIELLNAEVVGREVRDNLHIEGQKSTLHVPKGLIPNPNKSVNPMQPDRGEKWN